jgi:CelD/BcsL family acetyltransferase involved in cellulose biosynthesis
MRVWRVALLGDWEAYLGSLSKPVRRQARRTIKKMQQLEGLVYQESKDEASLEQGLAILVDLHQRRWEALGMPGCFADERFLGFMRDACRDFHTLGMVHISWLEHGGKPIVANIEFDGGKIDYVYQGGMDPDSRSLSPGWLHMVHLFKRSIALGKSHRDYLRGDEPYKKHWRGKPTQLVNRRIVAPHMSARLRHGAWMVGDSLKHWFKQRLRGGAPVATEASEADAETSENS